MKFAGSQAMRDMDRYTIDVVGVPSDTLMLRAAVVWRMKWKRSCPPAVLR